MLAKTASSSALLASPRNTISSMNMFAWNARPSSPMCASVKDKYLQSRRRRRTFLQKAMWGGRQICNRLLCNEDSLKKLVHWGPTLHTVINKHGHGFPQSQLDMLLMYSLALELINIHRIHHSGIRKQEERQGTPVTLT